jgi:hypothetical protein
MRHFLICLAATGCVAPQLPVAALAPGDSRPEFVIYERDMVMPDVPVVFLGENGDGLNAIREAEYKWFGISPLASYTHVIRYVVSWQGGLPAETRPWINKYIIQVALAGDGSRAQVLLLESETPVRAGRSPVRRSIGWITPPAFAELRQTVLRDAAALPEAESGLGTSTMYRSHSTHTRLELHSGGPAQIDLTRQGHADRPASVYRAGEHLIAEAERALGRPIRRP